MDDASLPMDIITKIPTHVTDPASLARLASSCKFWRNLIKDPIFLDCLRKRHRDHDFTPSLLLGFFYQDKTESALHLWQHEIDKNRCLAPSFIPTSELSPFIGTKGSYNAFKPLSLRTFIQILGASLNFYEPVASQDGFLVLCRRAQDTDGGALQDVLFVCNPLTGDAFAIPSHRSLPPDHYALFVNNDVGLDGCMSQSFQLVAIWIKKTKFICLRYSSKTRSWSLYPGSPELMPGLYLVSSSAVVSRGVIHWLCGSWKHLMPTLVATLHVGKQELSYLELPSEAKGNKAPLLANSTDGSLLLLFVQRLQMSLWKHSSSEFGSDTSNWVLSETIDMTSFLPLRVIRMGTRAKVRLEMFQGKSGTVVVWVEGDGLFLFSIRDRSMWKIDSECVTKQYRLCPYEIDWLSCLAITNLVVDGSLSLDLGRQKVQRRWRTLMAKNLTTNRKS